MTTASLGGEFQVPTIDGGQTRVKVPEGTQTGKQFRLKGKGMPVLRSTRVGEMYIQVVVETPRGPNTVAIRNNGGHDFPLAASVGAESVDRVPRNSTAAEAQVVLEAGSKHEMIR